MHTKILEAPVLNRILGPVSRALTPEAARNLVELRLDRKTQAHIDKLAKRCNEGKLSKAERDEYETYVLAIDFVSLLQAQARSILPRKS